MSRIWVKPVSGIGGTGLRYRVFGKATEFPAYNKQYEINYAVSHGLGVRQ